MVLGMMPRVKHVWASDEDSDVLFCLQRGKLKYKLLRNRPLANEARQGSYLWWLAHRVPLRSIHCKRWFWFLFGCTRKSQPFQP